MHTGVILLVRVLGDAKETLTLENVALPSFAEAPSIILKARFQNEGTVHEAPVGVFILEIRICPRASERVTDISFTKAVACFGPSNTLAPYLIGRFITRTDVAAFTS